MEYPGVHQYVIHSMAGWWWFGVALGVIAVIAALVSARRRSR